MSSIILSTLYVINIFNPHNNIWDIYYHYPLDKNEEAEALYREVICSEVKVTYNWHIQDSKPGCLAIKH